jgi:hypothetical protein
MVMSKKNVLLMYLKTVHTGSAQTYADEVSQFSTIILTKQMMNF